MKFYWELAVALKLEIHSVIIEKLRSLVVIIKRLSSDLRNPTTEEPDQMNHLN